MTKKTFINKIQEVKNFISKNRIADAIALLMRIASAEGQYKITDALSQLKQNYSYMIHYMLEGFEDNTRAQLYQSIRESLLGIADDLLIEEMVVESPELYYSAIRTCVLNNTSLSELLNRINNIKNKLSKTDSETEKKSLNSELFSTYRYVFGVLWTTRKNDENNELIFNWISEHRDDSGLVTYFLSAIFLSLIKFYDSKKLILLIKLYNACFSDQICAISLVAILLTFNTHLDRVNNDPEIITLLKEQWSDSKKLKDQTGTVIKNLLHTFDTERAFSKMNNEVIPELMKMRPDFIKNFGDIKSIDDIEELEDNPAWEKMMLNSGIADKLQELSEMQSKGADLVMISFAKLKQFHFFNYVDSWFLPFTSSNPLFNNLPFQDRKIKFLESVDIPLCDSDRYSLELYLQNLTESQSNNVIQQFEMQLNQAKEMLGDSFNQTSILDFDQSVRIFINVIHRFFKLFNKHIEFDNPLTKLIKLDCYPVIGGELLNESISQLMAEYYFRLEMYEYALYWFNNIVSQLGAESFYWEKIGYCYQILHNYEEAMSAYKKAELLYDPSPWLLRQLAIVSDRTGNLKDAASYYEKALESDPENISLLFNLGNINLELGNIPQAIQAFYHANYISSQNIKIWRAIGWAELLNKNFEKSEQYYKKIIALNNSDSSEKPTSTDFMNAGHANLLMGNLQEASKLYNISATMSPQNFEKDFIDDMSVLSALGIDSLTLNMLLDSVKMKE